MHDLAPLALPLIARSAPQAAAIGCGLVDGLTLYHVKARVDRAPLLEATLGMPETSRAAMIGSVEALWVGPGEWILLAAEDHGGRLTDLLHRLGDHGAAVAEASDRILVVELDVDSHMLAGLSGLPAAALRPGSVARTRVADVPATIAAGLGARFRLLVDRTHAPHVLAWLATAI